MQASAIQQFMLDPDFQLQFDTWKKKVTKNLDLEIQGHELVPAMPREGCSVPRLLVFYRLVDRPCLGST